MSYDVNICRIKKPDGTNLANQCRADNGVHIGNSLNKPKSQIAY